MSDSRDSAGRTLRSRVGTRAGGLIPVALAAYLHYPITRDCFRADDFLNLYQINNYSLFEYLIIPNAGHLLVARNVVFYLSWLLFGTNPAPYLWSAFLTHLLNVWLLFLVIDVFTRSRSAAVLGAAMWGACPLHPDAIGYYAVYGHVLVGTVVLLVMLQAGRAAAAETPPNAPTVALWYALTLVAVTCFGTGITFAMVLPFTLALLLPRWRARWRWRLPLLSLIVVVPILYMALHKLYEIAFSQQLATLLGFKLILIQLPGAPVGFVRVLAFGIFRLLLGPLPATWAFPASYALLAALLVALGVVVRRAPDAVRRRIGAWVVLTLACYGAIVLTRLFRIYDLPADVMSRDGRFHYVPLIPLTVLLAFLWQPLGARLPRVSAALIGAWCALAIAASLRPAPQSERCLYTRQQLARALDTIRAAIDRTPVGETASIPNRGFAPVSMKVVFPGLAALFTIYYPDDVVDGRRVQFIERDPQVIDFAQKGRRSRILLVPPP